VFEYAPAPALPVIQNGAKAQRRINQHLQVGVGPENEWLRNERPQAGAVQSANKDAQSLNADKQKQTEQLAEQIQTLVARERSDRSIPPIFASQTYPSRSAFISGKALFFSVPPR
jgi:hypothetical protein